MWSFYTTTMPVARKDYDCDAYWAINNAGYGELDFTPEEWAAIQRCRDEGGMILKGQTYLRVSGIWEGEWEVFRARPELDDICHKYDWYVE